jgi:5-(carboxyamino)imidazole ribonucleotide synthase
MNHIAIFGCGQLAQMTAQAGIKLGLRFSFIADTGEDTRCVNSLGNIVISEPGQSAVDLFNALGQPDIITVEKEMVDAELLKALKKLTMVYPCNDSIKIAQNRIREKNYIRECGIPTADFEVVTSKEQLTGLAESFGFPIYIKAAESGYDGYHQWRLKSYADIEQSGLLDAINNGVSLIAEKHVPYHREVSVIAARSADGSVVLYPLMENRHEEGVLIATIAPAPKLESALEAQAFDFMSRVLTKMDYVGVLTMECFETDKGIVVNELAPRVHNSGHWTIEGSATSQFENHCRAIADMPLGETGVKNMMGLVNMLGKYGNSEDFTSAHYFYHDYGKSERARRKLGHVTMCASSLEELYAALNKTLLALYGDQYLPYDA